MAQDITDKAEVVFRDSNTINVPSSGPHEPVKGEIRALFNLVDAAYTDLALALTAAGENVLVVLSLTSVSGLSLDYPAKSIAFALSGSAAGIYLKSGSEGTGYWTLTSLALTSEIVEGINAAILVEESARISADDAEMVARIAGDLAEAQERASGDTDITVQSPNYNHSGDAPLYFTNNLTGGDPSDNARSLPGVVTSNQDGYAVRITGAGTLSVRTLYPLEAGRVYLVRYAVRRIVNAANPATDYVRCAIGWYDQSRTEIGSPATTTVSDLTTLTTGSGRVEVSAYISRTAGDNVDIVSPSATRYVRPFVTTLGTSCQTAIEVISWTDVTDAVVYSPDVSELTGRVGALEALDAGNRLDIIESELSAPGVLRLNTVGDAEAYNVPVSVQALDILGYTEAGDNGGGVYKRVSSEPAHDGKIQSDDGAWWELTGTNINPMQFGAIGDGEEDDTDALLKWADYHSAKDEFVATILPGTYLCDSQIHIVSATIKKAVVSAYGAEIVITASAATNRRYFRISNTEQVGGDCVLNGLSMRHNRAVSRESNTDMISVSGFARYVINDPVVQNSDNMGLVVGRGDPLTFAPESVTIKAPRIGGLATAGDVYGTIGDTGIWVTSAPKVTHIISPCVKSTGDDGILVGHTENALAGHVYISDADVQDAGSNGIVVSAPEGRITGRVNRTNNSGVNVRFLDGAMANKMRVDVEVLRAGQLQAGDIGVSMISKANPYGIWAYYEGTSAGELNLDGSRVHDSYAAGVNLQATGSTTVASDICGKVYMSKVAEPITGGVSGSGGLIRRSPVGTGVFKKVSLEVEARDIKCHLANWICNGGADDEKIDLQFKVFDCAIDSSLTNQPLCNFEGNNATKPVDVTVDIDMRRTTFGRPLRAVNGALATDIIMFIRDENGLWGLNGNQINVSNTGTAARLRGDTHYYRRNIFVTGGDPSLLAELNPDYSWDIRVFPSDATETGAFWIGYYNQADQTAQAYASSSGSPATPISVTYNGSSTRFPNGAVEVSSTVAGWSGGATLTAIIACTAISVAVTGAGTN